MMAPTWVTICVVGWVSAACSGAPSGGMSMDRRSRRIAALAGSRWTTATARSVPLIGQQEHRAGVGQGRHHQLGQPVLQFLLAPGRGHQVAGVQQQGELVLGGVGRDPGGLLARSQFCSLFFAALPGREVHDERGPAQRAVIEDRRPDDDGHAVPVAMQELPVIRLPRAGTAHFLDGLVEDAHPLRGRDARPR